MGNVPLSLTSSILNCGVAEVCLHLSRRFAILHAAEGREIDEIKRQVAVPVPVGWPGKDIAE